MKGHREHKVIISSKSHGQERSNQIKSNQTLTSSSPTAIMTSKGKGEITLPTKAGSRFFNSPSHSPTTQNNRQPHNDYNHQRPLTTVATKERKTCSNLSDLPSVVVPIDSVAQGRSVHCNRIQETDQICWRARNHE